MISAIKAYDSFYNLLLSHFDEREARNLSNIYFEDTFSIKNNFENKEISLEQYHKLKLDARQLLDGQAIQYITGIIIFYGYKFKVTRDVLIPRPETEELVYWISRDCKMMNNPSILDIGTGSGCIPISLKKELPNSEIEGLDISLEAVNIATENAVLNDCNLNFFSLNILDQDQWAHLKDYDILVSNPPYVTREELSKEEQKSIASEPALALYVDPDDPLKFYRTIIDFALYKQTSKHLYFEISEYRVDELKQLLEEKKLMNYEFRNDMQGKSRMLKISF